MRSPRSAIALAALAAVIGCDPARKNPAPPATNMNHQSSDSSAASSGVLSSRPRASSSPAKLAPGRTPLRLGAARDGLLYVPPGVDPKVAAPLVVFFHGAGGDAGQFEMVRPFADRHRALVLSVDSRASTWDVIVDEIGPDVVFLDRALAWTFGRFAVDPKRIAVSGFSDGASYALSLGLANGDLFRSVMAFSPGFTAPPAIEGKPRVFVSHGTKDAVLPVDRCGRNIVRRLERSGYDVVYREFDGPHAVPADIAGDAFAWFLG